MKTHVQEVVGSNPNTHRKLDGHFSHLFVVIIALFVYKKEAEMAHIRIVG